MTTTPSALDDILTVPDDIEGMRERYAVLFPDAPGGFLSVRPRYLVEPIDDHQCGRPCSWQTQQDAYRWTPETPVVPT